MSESDDELSEINDDDENEQQKSRQRTVFPCNLCDRKFFRERRLEGHLRQHQGLKVGLFIDLQSTINYFQTN